MLGEERVALDPAEVLECAKRLDSLPLRRRAEGAALEGDLAPVEAVECVGQDRPRHRCSQLERRASAKAAAIDDVRVLVGATHEPDGQAHRLRAHIGGARMARQPVVGEEILAGRMKGQCHASEHSRVLGDMGGKALAYRLGGFDEHPQTVFLGLIERSSAGG